MCLPLIWTSNPFIFLPVFSLVCWTILSAWCTHSPDFSTCPAFSSVFPTKQPESSSDCSFTIIKTMYIRNLNCPKEYILSDFLSYPIFLFPFPRILSPETVLLCIYLFICATYNICMYLRMYAYILFFHDWKECMHIYYFSMYTVNIILFGLHQILIYESDRKALWRGLQHWEES